jgi:predicted alpha/beta superfamily hydrolase
VNTVFKNLHLPMSKITGLAFVLLCFMASANLGAAQSSKEPAHLWTVGEADSLYSNALKEQRSFWVHLPGGRPLMEGQRYPVIYLLDGESHLGGLAAVQEYYNQFRMPEMIVVGISNAQNRTRDLTPSEIDSRNGAMVGESGGSAGFTSFLADDLIPFIDSKYPTTTHRVLVGHSYGGLFTIHTLINRPELFTNYVALDPSLDWDEQRWLAGAMRKLEERNFTGKGLFMAVANEIIRFSDQLTVETVVTDTTDFSQGIRSSLSFAQRLEEGAAEGLRFDWAFYEKDIHGSVPLVGMRDAFVYLYDFWELKSPSLYNNPDTPTATLLELIRAQSENRRIFMGYPLPMEEELLDMLSFMSLDAGQADKARAVLELSAEYYPESGNVHASLTEVCLSVGDFECAERHAGKADALFGGNEYAQRVATARNSR